MPGYRLATELSTLFGALRGQAREALRECFGGTLPRRSGAGRSAARVGGLHNMTSIYLRPPAVAARIVSGHGEGDLIKGAMNRRSVGTLVERTSRSAMLVWLEGGCATDILDDFKRRVKSVPQSLRKTMTCDQGSEVDLYETARRQTQHRHLLLRPSQSLRARLQRKRQWPHSRVPSQGHGPEQCQLPTTRFHRTRPQQPPAQHPRL